VQDFFGPRLWLEGQELILKDGDPRGSSLWDDPSPLSRPGLFDHIPGVIVEHRLEFSPDRLRVVGDGPVERTEGCRLLADGSIGCREVLIRGYGDQGERDAVEHYEGSQDGATINAFQSGWSAVCRRTQGRMRTSPSQVKPTKTAANRRAPAQRDMS
jgi:hypothetical protein